MGGLSIKRERGYLFTYSKQEIGRTALIKPTALSRG